MDQAGSIHTVYSYNIVCKWVHMIRLPLDPATNLLHFLLESPTFYPSKMGPSNSYLPKKLPFFPLNHVYGCVQLHPCHHCRPRCTTCSVHPRNPTPPPPQSATRSSTLPGLMDQQPPPKENVRRNTGKSWFCCFFGFPSMRFNFILHNPHIIIMSNFGHSFPQFFTDEQISPLFV